MQSYILILDSNEFLIGLLDKKSASGKLLDILEEFTILVSEIILEEVKENLKLKSKVLNAFLELVYSGFFKTIQDAPAEELVKKYSSSLKKADALIAAYCEWLEVDFLISENRHFLKGFRPRKFKVRKAEDFLKLF